jgi:hypothetical protein
MRFWERLNYKNIVRKLNSEDFYIAENYTIIWHLIKNDETYEDETGYEKGEDQKRKIIETEIFSVDVRIKIISGIIAIMGHKEGESALRIE